MSTFVPAVFIGVSSIAASARWHADLARTLGSRGELRALREQSLAAIKVRVVERAANRFERQTELAADDDLLQAQQVIVAIEPVARLTAPARREQPHRVVVMQGANRYAAQRGDFLHLIHTS
jgi:hypothetical protein